jgi:hypothetical protein
MLTDSCDRHAATLLAMTVFLWSPRFARDGKENMFGRYLIKSHCEPFGVAITPA